MYNLAILALTDFENWNNQNSVSIGGATGVIKNILPYLDADRIFLMGITSNKKNLYNPINLTDKITIIPIVYITANAKIPIRITAFFYSVLINRILRKHNIHSIYAHAEEISYWIKIKPERKILYHMHGASNAMTIAKNKCHRNVFFIKIWEYIRTRNIQKATKIIAIDRDCYNLTKKQNREEDTILLTNFVDTQIFFKDKANSELLSHIKEKILIFVGRLEEVKGLELFVDTLIELNTKGLERWKGVFVGYGTYKSTIENYIREKSAKDLFYFTGPVYEQTELRNIYNHASVLMVSSHTEGIPMVILESLACGTPVVSTNVGGIKEFIADDKMCFVNDQRDSYEFSKLIWSISDSKNRFDVDEFMFSVKRASKIINKFLGA